MWEKLKTMEVEDIKSLLTCCICLDIFKNPRMLPCFHTFCKKCLTGLPTCLTLGKNGICCPMCRAFYENGQDKNHPVLEQLIELYRNKTGQTSEVDSDKEEDGSKTCKSCKVERGIWYCVECKKKSCENCHKSHYVHVPYDYSVGDTALTVKGESYLLRYALVFCREHGGEPLEHFCKPCNYFICSKCITIHIQNKKKDVFDIHLRTNQRVFEQDEAEARSLACLDQNGDYIPDFTVVEDKSELIDSKVYERNKKLKEAAKNKHEGYGGRGKKSYKGGREDKLSRQQDRHSKLGKPHDRYGHHDDKYSLMKSGKNHPVFQPQEDKEIYDRVTMDKDRKSNKSEMLSQRLKDEHYARRYSRFGRMTHDDEDIDRYGDKDLLIKSRRMKSLYPEDDDDLLEVYDRVPEYVKTPRHNRNVGIDESLAHQEKELIRKPYTKLEKLQPIDDPVDPYRDEKYSFMKSARNCSLLQDDNSDVDDIYESVIHDFEKSKNKHRGGQTSEKQGEKQLKEELLSTKMGELSTDDSHREDKYSLIKFGRNRSKYDVMKEHLDDNEHVSMATNNTTISTPTSVPQETEIET